MKIKKCKYKLCRKTVKTKRPILFKTDEYCSQRCLRRQKQDIRDKELEARGKRPQSEWLKKKELKYHIKKIPTPKRTRAWE